MSGAPADACPLIGGLYSKRCLHCMVRKIKYARSADHRTSRRIQIALFEWMGQSMAEAVKTHLNQEKTGQPHA